MATPAKRDIPTDVPLWDVRDVIESFRTCEIINPRWNAILSTAAAQLQSEAIREPASSAQLADVAHELRQLLDSGLDANRELLDHVAAVTANLVQTLRIPGIPSPDDDNWAFPEVTSA